MLLGLTHSLSRFPLSINQNIECLGEVTKYYNDHRAKLFKWKRNPYWLIVTFNVSGTGSGFSNWGLLYKNLWRWTSKLYEILPIVQDVAIVGANDY